MSEPHQVDWSRSFKRDETELRAIFRGRSTSRNLPLPPPSLPVISKGRSPAPGQGNWILRLIESIYGAVIREKWAKDFAVPSSRTLKIYSILVLTKRFSTQSIGLNIYPSRVKENRNATVDCLAAQSPGQIEFLFWDQRHQYRHISDATEQVKVGTFICI